MSNKRDIEPSLDFFELRRRHEEYKNSQRKAQAAAESPEAETVVEARPVTEVQPSIAEDARVAAEPADEAPVTDARRRTPSPRPATISCWRTPRAADEG